MWVGFLLVAVVFVDGLTAAVAVSTTNNLNVGRWKFQTANTNAALHTLELDLDHLLQQDDQGIEYEQQLQYVRIGPLTTSKFLGNVAYSLVGPDSGELVVLVSDVNTWLYQWHFLTAFLVEHGYRVLAYDHIGFGFSDDPDTTTTAIFDDTFYREVLEYLLTTLFPQTKHLLLPTTSQRKTDSEPRLENNSHVGDGRVVLIGHGIGGAISLMFAASNPSAVSRLVLLAPSGFTPKPLSMKMMTVLSRFSVAQQSLVRTLTSLTFENFVTECFQNPSDSQTAKKITFCKQNQDIMWQKHPNVFANHAMTMHNFHAMFQSPIIDSALESLFSSAGNHYDDAESVNKSESEFEFGQPEIPILVLVGENDKVSGSQAIVDKINMYARPRTEGVVATKLTAVLVDHHVVPRTKHLFFLENMNLVHGKILSFFSTTLKKRN